MNISTDPSNFTTSSPTTSSHLHGILGAVLNSVFLALGVFSNGLVLICFFRSNNLNKNLAYYLIKVLSWSDLLTVATTHPMYIYLWMAEASGYDTELYRKSSFHNILITILGASASVILIMNVERYLAVIHPYKYGRLVSKRRLLTAVVAFFVLLWCVPSGILNNPNNYCGMVAVVLFLSSTTFTYMSIYLVARRHQVAQSPAKPMDITGQNRTTVLANLKLAKTYFFSIVSMFVFYLPSFIAAALEATGHNTFYVTLSFQNAIVVNSTVNSFIFFWRNRQLRQEAKRGLKAIFL